VTLTVLHVENRRVQTVSAVFSQNESSEGTDDPTV